MAYQANRGNSAEQEDPQTQTERNNQNNARNIKNAADVAIASKNPYAMAAGGIVKAADKLTGGKSSEALGKALTKVTQNTPGGRQLQEGLNRLSESGASDKIGQAASMANGLNGSSAPGAGTNSATEAAAKSSEGSSGGLGKSGLFGGKKGPSSFFDDEDTQENQPEENPTDILGSFTGNIVAKKVIIAAIPLFILLLLFMTIGGAIGGGVADFDDALGANSSSGGETGDVDFEPSNPEAASFYDRINEVKLEMQASGKTVDVLKVVAVYHVINVTDNSYDYDYMTKSKIYDIANAMFDGNSYNEETFKSNLTNRIFLSYFPTYSQSSRATLTDEVFDYIDRYYGFVGDDISSCASVGSCNYDIKGFYIPHAGNVQKNLHINNLKVRLMECAAPYGYGNYTTPIDQPLVSFEEYVAGVANAEIGPSAPIEAIKAQMVAARSFALSRPAGMGTKSGKKLAQENGQWILQIASCVSDQVFCNINEGCSHMGSPGGYGGICRSGHIPGAIKYRDPLPEDSQLRVAAAATTGEVLVNAQGYIIATGYNSTTQHKFMDYANQGLNYKEILLKVYNSGYGATDVQKASCNSGSSNCGTASVGPYASWKQYEGPWTGVYLGNSGKTIKQIGCLATSVSILIAKSGVPTVLNDFNPGTFVEYLSKNGGFVSGGNFVWASTRKVAPSFVWQNRINVSGYSKAQKLSKISELLSQGYYVVAEVKGNTGQHWVAIDAVSGSKVIMMDPGSSNTDMWAQYDWWNTSTLSYYKAG